MLVNTSNIKIATNQIIRSQNIITALCESQVQGISYSGLEILLNKCFMPRIPASTAQDIMARIGIDMLDLRRTDRDTILINAGRNPETGAPFDKNEVVSKIENLPPEAEAKDVLPIVQAYNNSNDKHPHIVLQERHIKNTTLSNMDIVISLDEIQSKKQEETRGYLTFAEPSSSTLYKRKKQQELTEKMNKLVGGDWQNHKNVHNAVAVIEYDGNSYYIADTSVDELLLSVLAFLETNNLLYTRRCVFFTDGARNLKNAIERVFGDFKPQIILDWYHVSKRIMEMLSMALSGTIDQKRQYRSAVCKYLWVGDTDSAINELKSFEANGLVRNKSKLEEAINYVQNRAPYLTCYALRKELGLRNSSSPAEKANDILVAKRQKHNGMSWSSVGSIALAQITASRKNDLLESYLEDRASVNWFKVNDMPTPPNGSGQVMALVS